MILKHTYSNTVGQEQSGIWKQFCQEKKIAQYMIIKDSTSYMQCVSWELIDRLRKIGIWKT